MSGESYQGDPCQFEFALGELKVYPIDALVRDSEPSERARLDTSDLIRLVAELKADAGIRIAFHKPQGESRIYGHVALFGTAAIEIPFSDIQFTLGSTLLLNEHHLDQTKDSSGTEATGIHPSAAFELTRRLVVAEESRFGIDTFESRREFIDSSDQRKRTFYPTSPITNWGTFAFALRSMTKVEDELLTWTDLAPATDLEVQILLDEFESTYKFGATAHDIGTVIRARHILSNTGSVPPLVRSEFNRLSTGLRLQPIDPRVAVRQWTSPIQELVGHAKSQTLAEALIGIPSVSALSGIGMATRERPVPDRPLDPMPPAPANPVRVGWATDAFGQQVDAVLDARDLTRHLFVEGQSGSGKTTTILQLFWAMTHAGYQAIWLDPHGDGAKQAAAYSSELKDTKTYYVRHGDREHPVRINPLAEKDSESRERMLSELLELIQTMLDPKREGFVGERFKRSVSLVAQASFELFGERTSLTDVLALILTKEALIALRDAVKSRSRDIALRLDAELISLPDGEFAQLVSWLVSRLQPFLRTPALREILGTGEDSVDIVNLFDSGSNLIIDLASLELGQEVARVLGALWLLKIQNAIGKRKNKDHPVVLLIDEAHLYTFGALPGLLAQARKFGIGIVIATQAADNLTPELMRAVEANCGSAISLRTGIRSADSASARLGGWPATLLTRLPDLTAVASFSRSGIPTQAFTLHIDHHERAATAGWVMEKIEAFAEKTLESSLDELWAPYQDAQVLNDSNVISQVREFSAQELRRLTLSRQEETQSNTESSAQPRFDNPHPNEIEEPSQEFDLILLQRGNDLYRVIDSIRQQIGCGYAEAKKLADNVGGAILRGVSLDSAVSLKRRLEQIGANTRIEESTAVTRESS